MRKVRITVLRRAVYQDLFDDVERPDPNASIAKCPRFVEGQEFIVDAPLPEKPAGFCSWAWTDIQRQLQIVSFGGTHSNTIPPGIWHACCTDGLRPVTFRIEPIEGQELRGG